jgi:hypothetical protein
MAVFKGQSPLKAPHRGFSAYTKHSFAICLIKESIFKLHSYHYDIMVLKLTEIVQIVFTLTPNFSSLNKYSFYYI